MWKKQDYGRLKRHVLIFFIILLLGLLNMKAKAQQNKPLHWTGSVDSAWDNPGNWSANRIPLESDEVVIRVKGATVWINKLATCETVVVEEGCKLILSERAELRVTGNFNNSGDFSAEGSSVVFAGSSAQEIFSATPLTFYNLEIKNSSNNGVIADCKVNILNELKLRNGILETRDTVVVLNDNSNSISLCSEKSFIRGKLQRKIRSFADEKYLFPVGSRTQNKYFPAQIDVHSLEGTSFLTLSFEPLERYNKSQLNARDNEIGYDYVSPEGMWVFSPDKEPDAGWFDLRLWISNLTGLIDNLYGILKRPVGSGPESWRADFGEMSVFGGEGRVVADGYALRKYCTSFSEHVVAGGGEAIPIELLGFSAKLEKGEVNILWSTATETNNDYFVVEKSNGTDFMEVANIKGSGNSSVQRNYSAIDKKPFKGISYYRLKQIDFNGSYQYSKIVSINNAAVGNQMVIFPNPSERIFKLKFLNAVPMAEILVFNQHGSISFNKTFLNLENNPTIELKLWDELLPGIYYLQVNTGSGDLTIQQIIID